MSNVIKIRSVYNSYPDIEKEVLFYFDGEWRIGFCRADLPSTDDGGFLLWESNNTLHYSVRYWTEMGPINKALLKYLKETGRE